MIIEKVYIKNYRCFGEPPTIVEFSNSGVTALIGPNNIGKSTVLRVLDILLGDKWPQGRFSEDDFHNNDLNKDIVLACTFATPIEITVKENNIQIKGVVVRAKHLSTGYGESSIEVDYRLLESETNINILNFEELDIATYRRSDGTRGDSPIYIGQEIRNQLPVVITIPLTKLQIEQPTNRWSVLGRMLQKVEREFITDEEQKKNFEDKIKNAIDILKIKDFKEIENDIKAFWDEMKPANLREVDLKFHGFEPWRYYREFKLSIQQNSIDVPIETLGEGVQRLAIMAIYRAYLKRHGRHAKAVLLVEEPESYLHPQARKKLFHIFKKVVKEKQGVKETTAAEGQIIYTTHSEDFIECGSFDDIVIFLRNKTNSIEVRHVREEDLRNHTIALGQPQEKISAPRIHYRLIETISVGLKEALFSHKAIIVEGPCELELFRFFSDSEKREITIVSAGGKSNIPAIYSFLTAFGIPCLVVIDRDSEDKNRTTTDNTKIVKALIQENAKNPDKSKMDISVDEINRVQDGEIFTKGRILVFGENLESVLANEITDWNEILDLLRKSFNLPNVDKVTPRDIQALALAYFNNADIDDELKKKLENEKKAIDNLIRKFNDFISQEMETPQILLPNNLETSNELFF
ncbi:MAG: AAA family ATPase [Candidatus Altiarchaeota archaeon]